MNLNRKFQNDEFTLLKVLDRIKALKEELTTEVEVTPDYEVSLQDLQDHLRYGLHLSERLQIIINSNKTQEDE